MLLLGAGALLVSMAQCATAPAAKVVPKGKITLAWHAGLASRWLDPRSMTGQPRRITSLPPCTMP